MLPLLLYLLVLILVFVFINTAVCSEMPIMLITLPVVSSWDIRVGVITVGIFGIFSLNWPTGPIQS